MNVLRSSAHEFLLETRDPFANRRLDLALCFHRHLPHALMGVGTLVGSSAARRRNYAANSAYDSDILNSIAWSQANRHAHQVRYDSRRKSLRSFCRMHKERAQMELLANREELFAAGIDIQPSRG
jgi:hypothetical protein